MNQVLGLLNTLPESRISSRHRLGGRTDEAANMTNLHPGSQARIAKVDIDIVLQSSCLVLIALSKKIFQNVLSGPRVDA